MELPQAVKMLALHRQAFHDNYRDLWPNRILMSESFACDLVSEMMHLLGNSGVVVPYGTDANLKNIKEFFDAARNRIYAKHDFDKTQTLPLK